LTDPLRQSFAELVDNVHRRTARVTRYLPRRAGLVASLVLLGLSGAYGAVRGNHLANVTQSIQDACDAAANAAGFRIATISITGRKQLTDQDVLAAAGITPKSSLLFLDVEETRGKLEAAPWIGQATVRKLYPGHLDIAIEERDAFALWQLNGQISIIAEDGTVLGKYGERPVPPLPLVVGPGAAAKAKPFLALLDRHRIVREQLRAAILVADRRWNLKLTTGLDIRLPETEIAQALDVLDALERDKKILSRDLTAIDLRLPDRVVVRLSDEAAQAREQVIKEREKKKKKGGDA
jgi:cell division protein FtsQ